MSGGGHRKLRKIYEKPCKRKIVRLEKELQAETVRRKAAEARYEYVRRLNVRQFADLYNKCLRGAAFDSQVDAVIAAAKDAK